MPGVLMAFLVGCGDGGETPPQGQEDQGPQVSPAVQTADDERLDVGRTLLREGRITDAMMIFETVLRDRPELARANFFKGLALHERKFHASALDWYEAAAESDQKFPERDTLPYYMAWSYYYAGKPSEAQVQIDAFLATTDDRSDAHFLAGLIAFNDDRLEAAEGFFRRAIELSQGTSDEEREMARAWIRLSDVLMRLDRLEEAFVAASKATDMRPSLSEAWFRKYTILMRLGREDEANFARSRWKELRAVPAAEPESEP